MRLIAHTISPIFFNGLSAFACGVLPAGTGGCRRDSPVAAVAVAAGYHLYVRMLPGMLSEGASVSHAWRGNFSRVKKFALTRRTKISHAWKIYGSCVGNQDLTDDKKTTLLSSTKRSLHIINNSLIKNILKKEVI
jgi:hypothetical protein